jgi:sugar lactone lactonase YvrE
MRRLLILLGALLLAWAGLRMVPVDGAVAGWMVRDLLLVVVAAMAVAAWAALPLPTRDRGERRWPVVGRVLFGVGVAGAVAAGALQTLALPGAPVLPWIAPIWWGALLLLLAGTWWPGAVTRYAAPSFRWERDSRGNFVKRAAVADQSAQTGRLKWSRALIALLVLIIAAGAALRVGLALQGPAACLPAECALLADEGAVRATVLLEPLTGLYGWFGLAPLDALRLAQATVATLLLPVLAVALGGLATPAGVLLGTTAAAISLGPPLSGEGAPALTEAALLVLLVVAGAVRALSARRSNASAGVRGWAVAGASLGALMVVAPAAAPAWLLWAIVLMGLHLWPLRREAVAGAVVLVGATIAGAALAGMPTAALFASLASPPSMNDLLSFSGMVLQELVSGGGILLVSAAVVGMGLLLRGRRRGAAVLAGALSTWGAVLLAGATDPLLPALALDAGLVVLAPWLLLLAGVAADQLLRALLLAWRPRGDSASRPAALVAAAVALLVVVQGVGVVRSWQGAGAQVANSSDREALAAAEFMASLREESGGSEVTVLAAPELLAHPALRLSAAEELAAGRLAPFDAAAIPLADPSVERLAFLLSPTDAAALEWLRLAYPAGVTTPLSPESAAPRSPLDGGVPQSFAEGAPIDLPALVAFRVHAEALATSRGATQSLFSADGPDDLGSGTESSGVGPLEFGWAADSPLPPPFGAAWSASLLVPETGIYTFTAQVAPDALISLQLDKRLILDSSAGLLQRAERLPAGAYQLDLRYRSGDAPGDVALLWQGPQDAEAEPIPLTALHSPALPLRGLLATTVAGEMWEGAALTQRKDPLVRPGGAPEGLDGPRWGTIWQGQLGAPRSGEYLIGAVAEESVVVTVAGRNVIERLGPASDDRPADGTPTVAEGTVYLEQGWHPFSIRTLHSSGTPPLLSLYWQPPGSGAGPLSPSFLVPIIGSLGDADVPLPELPAADVALGDADFSLSRDPAIWQPSRRLPPQNLPPLPLEQLWAVGSCGNDLGQLAQPRGIAFDPAGGLLYIADTGNRRIVTLALDGSGFAVLPIEALEEPVDVALTPEGDLLVLDTIAPRLLRYTPATGATTEVPLGEGFYRPRGLDVDPLGLIYIADTGGGRVAIVDADGTLQAALDGPGSSLAAGQPADVVAAQGSPWAIAAEHGRLWRLDTMGSLTAIQPTDTIQGPHLAHLGDRLFLSDPAGRRVLYLDGRGKPLGALADAGAFVRPTGVAVWRGAASEAGPVATTTLYVADAEACAISAWQGVVE